MTTIKICLSICKFPIVEEVSKKLGFIVSRDENDSFNIKFMDKNSALSRIKNLKPFQCINHFSGIQTISKRVSIVPYLNHFWVKFPEEYAFFPETKVLGHDKVDGDLYFPWVYKSAGKNSHGIDLKIFPNLKNIVLPRNGVLQRYITNPMLVDGKKADLRCYCLVTCLDPLMIYSFRKGVMRICKKNFSLRNMSDISSHISVEKLSEQEKLDCMVRDKHGLFSTGRKRCFGYLEKLLDKKPGAPKFEELMNHIDGLMLKTVLVGYSHLIDQYKEVVRDNIGKGVFSCFEILGFDVLLDENYNPHVLDVCHSPSLNTSCKSNVIEHQVLSELLEETFKLLALKEIGKRQDYSNFLKVLQGRLEAEMRGRSFKRIFPTKLAISKYSKILTEVGLNSSSSRYVDFFRIKDLMFEEYICDENRRLRRELKLANDRIEELEKSPSVSRFPTSNQPIFGSKSNANETSIILIKNFTEQISKLGKQTENRFENFGTGYDRRMDDLERKVEQFENSKYDVSREFVIFRNGFSQQMENLEVRAKRDALQMNKKLESKMKNDYTQKIDSSKEDLKNHCLEELSKVKKVIEEIGILQKFSRVEFHDHFDKYHAIKYEVSDIKTIPNLRSINNERKEFIIFEGMEVDITIFIGILMNPFQNQQLRPLDFQTIKINFNGYPVQLEKNPTSVLFRMAFKVVGKHELYVEYKNIKRKYFFYVYSRLVVLQNCRLCLRFGRSEPVTFLKKSIKDEVDVCLSIRNNIGFALYYEALPSKPMELSYRIVDKSSNKTVMRDWTEIKKDSENGEEFIIFSFNTEELSNGDYEVRISDGISKTVQFRIV